MNISEDGGAAVPLSLRSNDTWEHCERVADMAEFKLSNHQRETRNLLRLDTGLWQNQKS